MTQINNLSTPQALRETSRDCAAAAHDVEALALQVWSLAVYNSTQRTHLQCAICVQQIIEIDRIRVKLLELLHHLKKFSEAHAPRDSRTKPRNPVNRHRPEPS